VPAATNAGRPDKDADDGSSRRGSCVSTIAHAVVFDCVAARAHNFRRDRAPHDQKSVRAKVINETTISLTYSSANVELTRRREFSQASPDESSCEHTRRCVQRFVMRIANTTGCQQGLHELQIQDSVRRTFDESTRRRNDSATMPPKTARR